MSGVLAKPGVSLASVFIVCSVSAAGPLVTLTLFDGRTMEAEIQGFEDRKLILRAFGEEQTQPISEKRIKEIDFGDEPINLPDAKLPRSGKPTAIADLWADVKERRFERLFLRCKRDVFRRDTHRVLTFEQQLEDRLEKGELTPDERRDCALAMVSVLFALGEREKALRRLAKIRERYPADPVVRRYSYVLRSIVNGRRPYGPGRREPAERGRRGP